LKEEDVEDSFEPILSSAETPLDGSFMADTIVELSESTINELAIKSTCLTLLLSNLFNVELDFETRFNAEEF